MAVVNNQRYNMPTMVEIDGEEKEVYTQDEVEAKIAEEREELETLTQAQILEKDEELSATREKLTKLEQKDMNFEALRKSKTLTPEQEAEAAKNAEEMETLKSTVTSLTETVSKVQKQPLETAKEQFVLNNIGNDKDLLEKFDHFYSKIADGATTLKEVNEALVASFNAATGGARQPDFSGRMAHTSVSDNFADLGDAKQESEASQSFGKMLGLTPEDKKNFGGAAKTGTVDLFANSK